MIRRNNIIGSPVQNPSIFLIYFVFVLIYLLFGLTVTVYERCTLYNIGKSGKDVIRKHCWHSTQSQFIKEILTNITSCHHHAHRSSNQHKHAPHNTRKERDSYLYDLTDLSKLWWVNYIIRSISWAYWNSTKFRCYCCCYYLGNKCVLGMYRVYLKIATELYGIADAIYTDEHNRNHNNNNNSNDVDGLTICVVVLIVAKPNSSCALCVILWIINFRLCTPANVTCQCEWYKAPFTRNVPSRAFKIFHVQWMH